MIHRNEWHIDTAPPGGRVWDYRPLAATLRYLARVELYDVPAERLSLLLLPAAVSHLVC